MDKKSPIEEIMSSLENRVIENKEDVFALAKELSSSNVSNERIVTVVIALLINVMDPQDTVDAKIDPLVVSDQKVFSPLSEKLKDIFSGKSVTIPLSRANIRQLLEAGDRLTRNLHIGPIGAEGMTYVLRGFGEIRVELNTDTSVFNISISNVRSDEPISNYRPNLQNWMVTSSGDLTVRTSENRVGELPKESAHQRKIAYLKLRHQNIKFTMPNPVMRGTINIGGQSHPKERTVYIDQIPSNRISLAELTMKIRENYEYEIYMDLLKKVILDFISHIVQIHLLGIAHGSLHGDNIAILPDGTLYIGDWEDMKLREYFKQEKTKESKAQSFGLMTPWELARFMDFQTFLGSIKTQIENLFNGNPPKKVKEFISEMIEISFSNYQFLYYGYAQSAVRRSNRRKGRIKRPITRGGLELSQELFDAMRKFLGKN